MEVNEKVIFVITVLGTFLIILGILFALIDLYDDYKCSTTTNIKYWQENNCMKYYERSRNAK
ncbi:MAG: hypothetical protein VZQ62_00415 [Methanosphaera sp.]|nr:hypothetical protein [Methanosphaera sp.]